MSSFYWLDVKWTRTGSKLLLASSPKSPSINQAALVLQQLLLLPVKYHFLDYSPQLQSSPWPCTSISLWSPEDEHTHLSSQLFFHHFTFHLFERWWDLEHSAALVVWRYEKDMWNVSLKLKFWWWKQTKKERNLECSNSTHLGKCICERKALWDIKQKGRGRFSFFLFKK